MAWWPFGRKSTDDKSVETLLAEANAASPPSQSSMSPAGGFRLPVEDVFMITGRGAVVTGRVASGTGTVGMRVQVVRDGSVVATTTVTAIEKFRAKLETAQTGENVGLLLQDLAREQLQPGDLIQG